MIAMIASLETSFLGRAVRFETLVSNGASVQVLMTWVVVAVATQGS
jgi:hypothetical protein